MADPRILVVGGAGYVGSHMVKMLCAGGYHVTVLDNLSTGFEDAVVGGDFVDIDLGDEAALADVFAQGQFDAVMHFAGLIQVGDSVINPAAYYENNVVKTLTLLNCMRTFGVKRFVFSSTAAVYGAASEHTLSESLHGRPINPYGRTKQMIEDVLADYDSAYGLRSVCLRYFNAAGADPDGALGERHDPETHLIPLVLQAAAGRRERITVFGTDYATLDGTCIRDFVHVEDLCSAHALALTHLLNDGASDRINLGCGQGYSVREVIDTARAVTQREIVVEEAPPRAGDPARLVADTARAREILGWTPRYTLEDMVQHAWNWECRLDDGGLYDGSVRTSRG